LDRFPSPGISGRESTRFGPERIGGSAARGENSACGECGLSGLCLPVGLASDDLGRLDRIVERRQPVRRGGLLIGAGDPLTAVYALRSGSVKSLHIDEAGEERVLEFHFRGDLLGLDAVAGSRHQYSVRALEPSSVCVIGYRHLEHIAGQIPSLQRQLLLVMGREVNAARNLVLRLGNNSADARLAAWLLDMSARAERRGLSATELDLSMSRQDIGSQLGLAVETVSRVLGRFLEKGLLRVRRKHLQLLEPSGLRDVAGIPSSTNENDNN